MYQTLNLSHADAQEIVDAVRRRVEADKKAVAIAVTDSHGELVAFLKMDGCHLPPVQIAINKAFTAAREKRPSGAVGESSRTHPFPMTNFGDLRYTGFPGGVRSSWMARSWARSGSAASTRKRRPSWAPSPWTS